MRIVVQRVSEASVIVESELIASVKKGLLILVAIEDDDTNTDLEWMANKIIGLRIFDDENAIPNLAVNDTNGEIMMVSQFTLYASTKKGNRPSYQRASKGSVAEPLFNALCDLVASKTKNSVSKGRFGADMKVALVNDGPITIIIDSKMKE